MVSIIGLDVGEQRVGVAVSRDGRTALPHATWARSKGQAERMILLLIQELSANTLVVGLPLNEDNQRSSICDDIERFARRLQRRSVVSIEFIDEYGSTLEASERLSQVRSASKRREVLDSVAAVVILERYLERVSE